MTYCPVQGLISIIRKVWATDGLDFDAVAENKMTKDSCLVLNLSMGAKVAIGFDKLETEKVSLHSSMTLLYLSTNLSTVMTPDAIWAPEGQAVKGLKRHWKSSRCLDGVDLE